MGCHARSRNAVNSAGALCLLQQITCCFLWARKRLVERSQARLYEDIYADSVGLAPTSRLQLTVLKTAKMSPGRAEGRPGTKAQALLHRQTVHSPAQLPLTPRRVPSCRIQPFCGRSKSGLRRSRLLFLESRKQECSTNTAPKIS